MEVFNKILIIPVIYYYEYFIYLVICEMISADLIPIRKELNS